MNEEQKIKETGIYYMYIKNAIENEEKINAALSRILSEDKNVQQEVTTLTSATKPEEDFLDSKCINMMKIACILGLDKAITALQEVDNTLLESNLRSPNLSKLLTYVEGKTPLEILSHFRHFDLVQNNFFGNNRTTIESLARTSTFEPENLKDNLIFYAHCRYGKYSEIYETLSKNPQFILNAPPESQLIFLTVACINGHLEVAILLRSLFNFPNNEEADLIKEMHIQKQSLAGASSQNMFSVTKATMITDFLVRYRKEHAECVKMWERNNEKHLQEKVKSIFQAYAGRFFQKHRQNRQAHALCALLDNNNLQAHEVLPILDSVVLTSAIINNDYNIIGTFNLYYIFCIRKLAEENTDISFATAYKNLQSVLYRTPFNNSILKRAQNILDRANAPDAGNFEGQQKIFLDELERLLENTFNAENRNITHPKTLPHTNKIILVCALTEITVTSVVAAPFLPVAVTAGCLLLVSSYFIEKKSKEISIKRSKRITSLAEGENKNMLLKIFPIAFTLALEGKLQATGNEERSIKEMAQQKFELIAEIWKFNAKICRDLEKVEKDETNDWVTSLKREWVVQLLATLLLTENLYEPLDERDNEQQRVAAPTPGHTFSAIAAKIRAR